jgi:hypothetical protein
LAGLEILASVLGIGGASGRPVASTPLTGCYDLIVAEKPARPDKRVSLAPLDFQTAVSDLLKVKPPPKEKPTAKQRGGRKKG